MDTGIERINDRVKEEGRFVADLQAGMAKVIVGQKYLLDRLIIGLLANGHLLLEGVPGLAKTLSVRTLASLIDVSFQRIQFTPDLLPADLVGTLVYNPREATFTTRKGMSVARPWSGSLSCRPQETANTSNRTSNVYFITTLPGSVP